jgi:hypothetical protein
MPNIFETKHYKKLKLLENETLQKIEKLLENEKIEKCEEKH